MSEKTKDIAGFEFESDNKSLPNGKNYLLAIAIDKYKEAPLYNCVKDANDLIAVLLNRYNFEEENVFTIFDEAATLPNIYGQLSNLAKKVTESDSVIIYYSGHGYYDKEDKTGHLVPINANINGAVWEYLSNDNLLNKIDAINSFHTLLIADSCFSGSIFGTKNLGSISLAEKVGGMPSRWGLAAGRIELVSDGLHGENSPFAKSIITFLKNNQSPLFCVSELILHTKTARTKSSQTPIGGPLNGDQNGEFVFRLRKNENVEWTNALQENKLAVFQAFYQSFPEGRYADEAKLKIDSLLAKEQWDKILAMPDEEAYQIRQKLKSIDSYTSNFPKASNYTERDKLGAHLIFKEEFLNAKNNIYLLRDFARKNTPFKEEAIDQLTILEGHKKATEELENTRIEKERIRKEKEEQSRIENEQKKIEANRIKVAAAKKKKEQAAIQAEKSRIEKEEAKRKAAENKKPKPNSTPQKSNRSNKTTKKSSSLNIAKYVKNILIPLVLLGVIYGGKMIYEELTYVPPKVYKPEAYKDFDTKLWGYKKDYKIVIQPKYTEAGSFYSGEAKVKIDNHAFVINEYGRCIKDCDPPKSIINNPSTISMEEVSKYNELDNDKVKSITKAYLKPLKGNFTDKRNNRKYNWIGLKDHRKWTTTSMFTDVKDIMYYGGDIQKAEKYGGALYTFRSAQKACPEGWRLPTKDEWQTMLKFYGGTKENSNDNGKAATKALSVDGSSGLNLQYGGAYFSDGPNRGMFAGANIHGYYWSGTEANTEDAWLVSISKKEEEMSLFSGNKYVAAQCRCIEDK